VLLEQIEMTQEMLYILGTMETLEATILGIGCTQTEQDTLVEALT
jgi:hypothetical protein